MKRYLPFIIIAVVAVVAITAGTLIYRAKQARTQAAADAAAEMAALAGSGKPGAMPPHIRGPAKAAVTIEEFADFQCPPCGILSEIMQDLKRDYADNLRIVFRHYPLTSHQHARLAALAAEAAGMQGKFWEMHDMLYKNRATWIPAPDVRPFIHEYARAIGLDPAQFERDLDSEKAKGRLAADRERADSLGVDRTPSVFINQRLLPYSSLNELALRGEIEAIINGKTQP